MNVVQLAVGEMDEARNAAAQIEQGTHWKWLRPRLRQEYLFGDDDPGRLAKIVDAGQVSKNRVMIWSYS